MTCMRRHSSRQRSTRAISGYVPFIICVWAVSHLTLAVEAETNTQHSVKGFEEPTTDCHEIAGVEKLISQLSDITGEWETLGEDLGVSRSKIDEIKLDEPYSERKRRAVLRAWYDSQEQPCWEPVIEVLKGMERNRLAGEIEKCVAIGCDCELVQCTCTVARDADDSSNEAGYSESTLSGYYTIIGSVIGSVILGAAVGIFIHIYCWTDKNREKSSEMISDESQIFPHSTSRTEPIDGFRGGPLTWPRSVCFSSCTSFRSRHSLQTRPKESYCCASHELPTPVPYSPENRPPIARYADYLKAYYRTAPIAPDIPECCKWPPTPSTQYINLAVVKKEHVSRAEADKFTKATLHGSIDEILNVKKAIRMEDVLKPEGEAEVKRVLVEGAPGVGKSTFAWELCRRWDEIEAMRKYSVVVLLRLREKRVQEAKTVADLFYHDNPSIQQAVAEEITSKGGADTLLVLDGFDEVPASLQKSSLLVQIIQGVCLPKATVLVTSRPSARADLLAVCRPQVQKHIEVLGFTHELIEQYASSIFASNHPVLADFLKYISTNPVIRSMMYIPLNSAIVVEIYRENRTVGRPIPQTMTQLYNELTLTLLQRYMSEKGEHPILPKKLEDLPRNLYLQLLSLARFAFEHVVKQEVIFDRLPDGCSPLGLMNISAELYVSRRNATYNFLHLVLQEFLAAFYISQLPASEQKVFFEIYSDNSHMDVVWRFVAGLTGFKDIGWDVVRKRDREYTTTRYLFGLFCAGTIICAIRDVLSCIQFYYHIINTHTFHIINFSVLLTSLSYLNICSGMYIDLSQRRYRKINTEFIQFVFLVIPSIILMCIIDFYINCTASIFTISTTILTNLICTIFMSYFFFYISMRLHRYIYYHQRHQLNIKLFIFLVACLMCWSMYITFNFLHAITTILYILSLRQHDFPFSPLVRRNNFMLPSNSYMVVFRPRLGELSVLLFTVFFLLFSLCILYHFTNILTIIYIFLLIYIITVLLWRQPSDHVIKFSEMPGLCIVWKFVVGVMDLDLVPSVWYHQMWLTQFSAQCLYEAQEEADCVLVGPTISIRSNTGYRSYDCFVVGYCIAVSRCSWILELGIFYSHSILGADAVEMLVCGLKSKEEVQGSIEELDLSHQPIKQEGVAHLKGVPHQVLRKLSKLDLRGCELDGAALDLLSDIIPIMTSLKHLNISFNPAGEGGTVKLLQALGHLHSLHTLGMNNINIGCDDIMALSQLIRPTGCLKNLWIGDENMPAECVKLMMKTVLSPSSLEDLYVWDVDFTSYQNCFLPLAENHNLTRLEFHHCMISSEILAESLYNNTTLRKLTVGNTRDNLTKETADALIKSCKLTHKYLHLPKQYRWSDWTRCTLL